MVAASCIRHIFLPKTNNCFENCSEWPVKRHFPPELSRLRDVDVDVECNWFAPFIQSCSFSHVITKSTSGVYIEAIFLLCFSIFWGGGGVTIFSRNLLAWSAEPRGDRDNRKDKPKNGSKKSFSCEWPWSTHRSKPFRHGQQTGITTSGTGTIFFKRDHYSFWNRRS